ncbi:hypothetical protein [Paenibacillus sp. An7]|uniref:hypothetical protein n=1 Tax=Paenibacillus sp. An7 TaxID=2689577 RepID=UPI001357BE0C|nr:hypothetical protein [Paenibacillus sp. An7]
MKSATKVIIGVLVVIIGILIGSIVNGVGTLNLNMNQQITVKNDPFKELRSNGKHTKEEKLIKDKVDNYMYENFGGVFNTTWYDSILASGAVINEYGKLFLVVSKGDDEKAINYVRGLLSFFNDKTIDEVYQVTKVVLVDKEYNLIKQVETIK